MNDKCAVTVLVFSASLRDNSLNDRLATLAARSATHGASVDRAAMADFDCPSYDGDEERDERMPEGAGRLRGPAPRQRRIHHRLTGVQRVHARHPEERH